MEVIRLEFLTNSYEETIELGNKIGSLLSPNDCILLTGDLGAGKTTLTKGIGKGLGIEKNINSPTFTIVKEYHGNLDLYHIDLYRLESLGQDFDLEEYFNLGGVTVVEWPFNVKDILPNSYLEIKITYIDDNKRKLNLIPHGKRYEEMVGEIKC